MARYSAERKASVLKKLLPPRNRTISEVAKEEGSSEPTFTLKNAGWGRVISLNQHLKLDPHALRSVLQSCLYFLLGVFTMVIDLQP